MYYTGLIHHHKYVGGVSSVGSEIKALCPTSNAFIILFFNRYWARVKKSLVHKTVGQMWLFRMLSELWYFGLVSTFQVLYKMHSFEIRPTIILRHLLCSAHGSDKFAFTTICWVLSYDELVCCLLPRKTQLGLLRDYSPQQLSTSGSRIMMQPLILKFWEFSHQNEHVEA